MLCVKVVVGLSHVVGISKKERMQQNECGVPSIVVTLFFI